VALPYNSYKVTPSDHHRPHSLAARNNHLAISAYHHLVVVNWDSTITAGSKTMIYHRLLVQTLAGLLARGIW